jgi:hypothetical protein
MSEPRTHLIWSLKWSLWHCRDQDGRAAGYTSDVARAGLFEERVASSFAREPTVNRAVPAAEAVEHLRTRLTELALERETVLSALNLLEAA